MNWSAADIADALHDAIRERTADDDRAQAVLGIDALDELSLHPILHAGLRRAGFGVYPEERYPSDRGKRRRSEGERCDIVLTPDDRALAAPDVQATLFAPADAVELSDAFWLEVKVVTQATEEGGNPRYAAELMEPVRRDVRKLAREALIRHGAVALVLFTADAAVAEHDLRIWQAACVERDLPIEAPRLRSLPLTDRIGNGHCAVAVYPVHQFRGD
jgi:hypothetical protein